MAYTGSTRDHAVDAMRYLLHDGKDSPVATIMGIPFPCRAVDISHDHCCRKIIFRITLSSGKLVTLTDDMDQCPTQEFKNKLLLLRD